MTVTNDPRGPSSEADGDIARDGVTKKNEPPSFRIDDFDDMLEYVGGWGFYQYRLQVIFLICTVIYGYLIYAPIIYVYLPQDDDRFGNATVCFVY